MPCCRCHSLNTFPLDNIHPNDHTIYRCRQCGLIFSPNHPPIQSGPTTNAGRRQTTTAPKGRAWHPSNRPE